MKNFTLRMLFMSLLLCLGSGAWAQKVSTLTFTAACNGSGTADDGAAWTVTSDGAESQFDGTSGIHYGTNKANVTYLQLSTSSITGTITKVVVNARDAQAKATVSVKVGGTAFTCSGSATATNTSADYTFTGSGSGEIVVRVDRGSSQAKAIYVKSIAVTYSTGGSSDPSAVATPTFSPEAGTYTETQSVTIASTEGATIYYTTDGSTPTTGSTQYTSAITVSESTTIKAIAVKEGMTNSAVATAEYVIEEPVAATNYIKVTSMDDIEVGAEYLLVNAAATYAMGAITTVSSTSIGSIVSVTAKNNVISITDQKVNVLTLTTNEAGSYIFNTSIEKNTLAWVSGNSLTTNSSGYTWTITYSDGVPTITNNNDQSRKLQFNSSASRFACYTSSQGAVALYKKESTQPSISFAQSAVTASIEDGTSITIAATAKNAGDAAISYTSSKESVATVAADGVVTLLAAGQTTITATITVDGVDYTASYELTVIEKEQAEAGLAFSETNCKGTMGEAFTAPTLTTADDFDGTVTYSSSDETVATVNAETGAVELIKSGTVTITATSSETVNFKAGEASYTITVAAAAEDGVFDFALGLDYGSGVEKSAVKVQESEWTAKNVTMNLSGRNCWFTDNKTLRLYKATGSDAAGEMVFSVTEGNVITKIVFTGTNLGQLSASTGYSSDTWSGIAKSVTLTAASATSAIQIETITVTYAPAYTRSVTAGNYGTLCVPFAVDAAGIKGATFYTVASKTVKDGQVKYISLEEVTTLTAGAGYLFEATADELTVVGKDKITVESPVEGGALVGTFTDGFGVPNGMYIVSNNQIYETANSFGKLNANRAYIDLSKVSEASEAKGRVLMVNGLETTGIESIEGAKLTTEDAIIYNLNGQRVAAPAKGIYIVNGKKVLVK